MHNTCLYLSYACDYLSTLKLCKVNPKENDKLLCISLITKPPRLYTGSELHEANAISSHYRATDELVITSQCDLFYASNRVHIEVIYCEGMLLGTTMMSSNTTSRALADQVLI